MEWKAIADATSEDALRDIKLWMFQENIRLENEKKDLEDRRNRFIQERAQFRDEMNSLNRKMVMERKRLKDENLFFDKKMQILQDGFRQLDMDRRKFEKDKRLYEAGRKNEEQKRAHFFYHESTDIAQAFFAGVNSSLGLKKRYRDLIKIFHPDNLCGDERIVQLINQEYEKKKME